MRSISGQFESWLLIGQQSDQWLTYCLLAGLGLLAVLLMILLWTRWGHAKPLSKCIALSILAHLILGGFAYGTRLIFNYQAPASEEPVSFSVVEEVPEQSEMAAEDGGTATEEPWEKFPDRDEHLPEPMPAEKLVNESPRMPHRPDSVSEPAFEKHELETEKKNAVVAPRKAPSFASEMLDDRPVNTQPVAPKPVEQQVQQPSPKPRPDPIPEVPEEVPTERLVGKPFVPEPPANQPQPRGIETEKLRHELVDQSISHQAEYQPPSEPIRDGTEIPRNTEIPENIERASAFQNAAYSANGPINRMVSRPRRLADGQPVPRLYENRFATNRIELVREQGGSVDTEQAVQDALKWLAAEQSDDGRWDASRFNAGQEANVYGHNRGGAGSHADTGITGLVVLAFLGAGNTHLEGPFRKNVQKGLEFLIRHQNDDGSMYGDAGLFARTYCHAMALMAISEAYSMTGDHRIRPFVVQGQKYTVSIQNRFTGGWRYRPGDDGDMSQFGWQVMALNSAQQAGIPVPDETRSRMVAFLRKYEKGNHGGLAAYRPAERPTRTMTAEALFCRRLLEIPVADELADEAIAFVMQELPGKSSVDNLYYWYYGSLAMYHEKMHGNAERQWQQWNQALTRKILAMQRKQGALSGSYPEDTLWSPYGGAFYSTAMATLCLEVYYRYQPDQTPTARTAGAKR